ncbi:hypothetical protein M3Y97_00876600 [Aphelenchoides bicaudatus]|nr:hypothetical protein M3Y97_00876600 [Aphelenchoides bicaudatus]
MHSTFHPVHGPTDDVKTTQSSTTVESSTQPVNVATTAQSQTNDQYSHYNPKQIHFNLSHAAERDLSSCFGKIKTSLSLNANFRSQFDKVVKVSRLDQIESLLGRKVADLCTHEERTEAEQYLRSFRPASQIANEIYRTLTNDERDHLNVWSNINDTDSEQKFYLSKFNSLPAQKLEAYSEAYNLLIGRLLNSTMRVYHNKFLSQLTEKDLKQMETFAREDEFEAIRTYIKEKLKNSKFTAAQKSELENFFANVYNKANIPVGMGTRQYELKHGNYEE